MLLLTILIYDKTVDLLIGDVSGISGVFCNFRKRRDPVGIRFVFIGYGIRGTNYSPNITVCISDLKSSNLSASLFVYSVDSVSMN